MAGPPIFHSARAGVMAERPAKRKRVELSLARKVDLLATYDVKPRPTQKELATKFNIGRQTVSDIVKRREHYLNQYGENMASSRKRLTGGKYEKLNDMVHAWYKMARAKNFSLSGPMLNFMRLYISFVFCFTT